ncbi:MAG: precorrin-8X methylmutase [Pseudanabaenaceae cyanobacterium]
MDWFVTEALSLSKVDNLLGEHRLSPAEYELVRQVVLATADTDYKDLIKFSEQSLQAGAAGLASRMPIITDTTALYATIAPLVRHTFANVLLCAEEVPIKPSTKKLPIALGLESLGMRYPEAIFAIGGSEAAFVELLTLIEKEEIKPSFVVAVPPCLVTGNDLKQRLINAGIPHIRTDGIKGSSVVAGAILAGLIELAWQAYGELAQV